MTTFATAMHLSTVGIDLEIIVHGSKTSVQLMKTAVYKLLLLLLKILYSMKGQIKCRQMLKPKYPVGCEYLP